MSTLSDIPGEIMVTDFPPNMKSNPHKPYDSLKDLTELLQKLWGLKKVDPILERFKASIETSMDVYLVGKVDEQNIFPRYMFSLLDHIIRVKERRYDDNQERESVATPSSIILCPSIKRGSQLKYWIRESLKVFEKTTGQQAQGHVKVLEHIPEDSDNIPVPMSPLGQIDILIMTGAALLNLFTSSSKNKLRVDINFQKLRYVIIEELVMKDNSYFDGVLHLLRYMRVIKGGKGYGESASPSGDIQLLFTGSIWNDDTEEIHSLLNQGGRKSIKILSSPVHALQYRMDAKWDVYHAKEGHSEKLEILLGLCKEFKMDPSEEKLMVVACSNSHTAKEVSYYISKEGKMRSILKTRYSEETAGIFNKHFDGLGTIYVVSDNAWDQITFHHVASIVHFDIDGDYLPETEPFFQKRYSCMWNRLKLDNKVGKRIGADIFETSIASHFLVTGNEKNFLELIKFFRTVKITVPLSLEEIWNAKFSEKSLKLPLCTILKCFGLCNAAECPERHEITQKDLDEIPDGITSKGEVAFRVVRAINPSLYIGKLTKFYQFDESDRRMLAKDYKAELKNREEQMQEYYSVEKNRQPPLKFTIDDIYGLCLPCPTKKSKTYVRVKLENSSSPKSSMPASGDISVFCIDTGLTVSIHVKELLDLPQRFQKWSCHCMQVILSNLLPHSFCNNEYLTDAIRASKTLTERKTWHGRVLLTLRDTVWINPMVQLEKDAVTGHPIQGCNLACELVNGGYATVLNTHAHMMIMLEHIRRRDPSYPEILHEFNIGESEEFGGRFYGKLKGDLREWISLPVGSEEKDNGGNIPSPHTMLIRAWVNPWEIFVTPTFEDGYQDLPKLELELSKQIEEKLLPKHLINPSIIMDYLEGEGDDLFATVVAVKTSVGNWQRGMILRKLEEEDVCNKFDVFLVDYGITLFGVVEVEEVVPLMSRFVNALPFHTICLRLAHIRPLAEEDWEMSSMIEFKRIMANSRQIRVLTNGKVDGSNYPCNYYAGVAIATEGGDGWEEIGIQLVNAEQAQLSPTCGNALAVIEKLVIANEKGLKNHETDQIMNRTDHDDDNVKIAENCIEWENFLWKNGEEGEESAPSIKEVSISSKEYSDEDWDVNDVTSFAFPSEDFRQKSNDEEKNNQDGVDEEWKLEVENRVKTLSLVEYQETPEIPPGQNNTSVDDLNDSDLEEYYDALEMSGDQFNCLTISPEEREAMRKLCQTFL